jgi:hypothetical protein
MWCRFGLLLFCLSLTGSLRAEDDVDITALRKKVTELEKAISVLRSDNAALREQLAKTINKAAPIPLLAGPKPQSNTPSGERDQSYWISSTGKRHNVNCRYFSSGNGHSCGSNDGVPCKICGG